MSLLTRLFGFSGSTRTDDHAAVRPLWAAIIAIGREPQWYAAGGIADTMPGRFDAITLVTALVLLRMEALATPGHLAARLGELYVEDMEGQLRQSGVGDVVIGKHMGKVMGALGGRIDALDQALAHPDDAALREMITRNTTLTQPNDPAHIAAQIRALAASLAALSDADLLAGAIPR